MSVKKDFEIKLVNQVDDKSCMAACMAMVAGVTIEKVFEVMQDIHATPYSEYEAMIGLVRLGVLPIQIIGREFPRADLYMVAVPSLNNPGGTHAIIIDLRHGCMEVFDPQNGRPDRKYYTRENISGNWCQLMICERVYS